MAFQLSDFREKGVVQHHDAKLTPETNLKGQDLFSGISLQTCPA
jgi:hypothetical protein